MLKEKIINANLLGRLDDALLDRKLYRLTIPSNAFFFESKSSEFETISYLI